MFIFLAEFKRVEEVHCTTYGFHLLMNQPAWKTTALNKTNLPNLFQPIGQLNLQLKNISYFNLC